MEKTKIVVIVGPTATGKTPLAAELAALFGGEVISADSMQVYRHMDIGTAKPTAEQTRGVPHHLIDIVEPDAEYTAARFRADASGKITEITARGHVAFIAGGTGLYVKALTRGLFRSPAGDPDLRGELLRLAEINGNEYLHERLKEVDPEAARTIHPNNLRRVVRALEVCGLAEKPFSELKKEHSFAEAPYIELKIGLARPRERLYADIEKRVDEMVATGLVEETRGLLSMGFSPELKPMNGLGYKEAVGYLEGRYTLERMIELIKRDTRHYAKRQITWFKKDTDIRWFAPEEKKDIIEALREFLS